MSYIKCSMCKLVVHRQNTCEMCELHWKLFDAEAKVEKLKAKMKGAELVYGYCHCCSKSLDNDETVFEYCEKCHAYVEIP